MFSSRGFTLIETLVYMALSAAGMLVLVSMLISGLNTRSLIYSQQRLVENQQFNELTLLKRLGEATTVTTPAGGEANQLVIDSGVSGENPVTFQVTNQVLTMTLGDQAPIALTSSDVAVTDFTVTRLSGTPPSIAIEITYAADTASGARPTVTTSLTYTLRYE